MLVTTETSVPRAKFPFVDIHGHQNLAMSDGDLASLVKQMDAMNMRTMNNLSGGSGERLAAQVRNARAKYPGRFTVFANIDWSRVERAELRAERRRAARARREGGRRRRAQDLQEPGDDGRRCPAGKRVAVDDPRLDPLWRECGKLGIPVVIHTAEPQSFFEPQDKFNERWLELKQFPQRARPPDKFPPFEQLLAEQHRVFPRSTRRPGSSTPTSAWLGGDLARLGKLSRRPAERLYRDPGAVLAEIGRQPRTGARVVPQVPGPRHVRQRQLGALDEYLVYFRVLETDDEYFDYYRKRHAFWKMYGLGLPDEVLKKVYYKNAQRLIKGMSREGFPQ